MDLAKQSAITERLEAAKAAYRSVSEYHVSWVGVGGQLTPKVTVWHARPCPEIEIRKHVTASLDSLVDVRDITFLEDV